MAGASTLFAASESSLRDTIKQEEAKAAARKESLKRLTGEEKQLDKKLGEAESAILALEKQLAEHRKQLSTLASASENVQKEYNRVLKEQQKVQTALSELLATVWNLHSRREGVGGRDLENWPEIDREYYWTADILKAVDAYQAELEQKEQELTAVIGKRDAIGEEVAVQMQAVDKQKAALLAERIKYEQRLNAVRKQKQSAESELKNTLKLIEDLNFDLKNARQADLAIDKAKGTLPWPTNGKIAQKFNPAAKPPVRGLGFATASGADVRAVHGGKVMFRDTMLGLGLVVVVQHGKDYFSIYAFLSDCAVSLGQNVNRGQTVGRSGYYPAINSNGLYFELRHHQNAINPESWFKKQ
ncbi:peptidoglycan DD-metalloendopeptidase family protein [Desulfovibrio sp. OttesenSCG-928-F07]|nr:peptidoglycan DD-metalloendopeptidase family protein [Desulfovibrio sp. OttesenSCG-928-F07]